MKKNTALKDIALQMQKYNFICESMPNNKLNKMLLVAVKPLDSSKIMVFCEDYGQLPVAEMSYTVNNQGVYLSHFVVIPKFQQYGIGRLMWNIALTHGDKLNKTCIYGMVGPTDDIRGVSDAPNTSFKIEQDALKNIYVKLGCQIDDDNFFKRWKPGEILKNTNKPIVDLVEKMISTQPEETK